MGICFCWTFCKIVCSCTFMLNELFLDLETWYSVDIFLFSRGEHLVAIFKVCHFFLPSFFIHWRREQWTPFGGTLLDPNFCVFLLYTPLETFFGFKFKGEISRFLTRYNLHAEFRDFWPSEFFIFTHSGWMVDGGRWTGTEKSKKYLFRKYLKNYEIFIPNVSHPLSKGFKTPFVEISKIFKNFK